MRVFVAGGTGAIGRPLIRQLKESGHEPIVLTRSDTAAHDLIAGGVNAIIGNALDEACVAGALARSKPDVVVNQLTNIPRRMDPKKIGQQFEATNELRTRGTANLAVAAAHAGVRQMISQSVAFFYAPGRGLATERDELLGVEFSPFTEIREAIRSCEAATLSNSALIGTVLRYGSFYGPGTQFENGRQADKLVKRRAYPIIGSGDGSMSFVHGKTRRARFSARSVPQRPVPTTSWTTNRSR